MINLEIWQAIVIVLLIIIGATTLGEAVGKESIREKAEQDAKTLEKATETRLLSGMLKVQRAEARVKDLEAQVNAEDAEQKSQDLIKILNRSAQLYDGEAKRASIMTLWAVGNDLGYDTLRDECDDAIKRSLGIVPNRASQEPK